MTESGIHMPSGMGGLMRYNEEYKSRLSLKPSQVIIFILSVIAFVIILKIFFPVQ